MKKYTIGILFDMENENVLLIRKSKPDWQKGKLNFPGGKIEHGEAIASCVAREFEEETGLKIHTGEWEHIGRIQNEGNYVVHVLTARYDANEHGELVMDLTDEQPGWENIFSMPDDVISNIPWLTQFAYNFHNQGNADSVCFGTFDYAYL